MLLPALAALVLAGCAYGLRSDPVQVTVAGVEALPGEGLELRMLVKLRVQNPNNRPVGYDGVYVRLDVLGKPFASGVSSESGVVPRFGETVIGVPVSVSVLRMVRQVIGLLDGEPVDRISYQMNGKLSGGPFHKVRFGSQGEFTLPTSTSANAPGASLVPSQRAPATPAHSRASFRWSREGSPRRRSRQNRRCVCSAI